MKVSDKGLAEIISHEAIVTAPYRDSIGVWTIGIGHTAAAGFPNPATMAKGVDRPVPELVALFKQDLAKYEAEVRKAVKVDLAQHEFDALVSFHYNTGAIARAKLTQALNRGDRKAAANGFASWVKPPEITERRMKELRLFKDGTYSNDGRASIYPASAAGVVQWTKGRRMSVADLLWAAPVPPTVAKVETVAPPVPDIPPPLFLPSNTKPSVWTSIFAALLGAFRRA